MALTPLPTPPSSSDPSTFSARADALVAALANMVTEINAQGSTPVGIVPCFSTSPSVVLTLTSAAAAVKLPCDIEAYDVGSCYDNVTNIRFAPTVAGKYALSASVAFQGTTVTNMIVAIYKNGSLFAQSNVAASGASAAAGIAADVTANGSTDFFEVYVGVTGTGTLTARGSGQGTHFSGRFISP